MKLFFSVLTALIGVLGAASIHAADPATGRALARQCQACHGMDGIAQIPIAPNLAGESRIYIETQLKAYRSGKREHEIMSVVAKGLSDEDISNLAAWYESIQVTATMPDTP